VYIVSYHIVSIVWDAVEVLATFATSHVFTGQSSVVCMVCIDAIPWYCLLLTLLSNDITALQPAWHQPLGLRPPTHPANMQPAINAETLRQSVPDLKLTRPFVTFDLETTGTDVNTARIVKFAATKLMPDKTVSAPTCAGSCCCTAH
jgi:hypothetical protein